MIYGDFELLLPASEEIFAYRRWNTTHDFIVVLNFSNAPIDLKPQISLANYQIVKSNYKKEHNDFILPWEARIYRQI